MNGARIQPQFRAKSFGNVPSVRMFPSGMKSTAAGDRSQRRWEKSKGKSPGSKNVNLGHPARQLCRIRECRVNIRFHKPRVAPENLLARNAGGNVIDYGGNHHARSPNAGSPVTNRRIHAYSLLPLPHSPILTPFPLGSARSFARHLKKRVLSRNIHSLKSPNSAKRWRVGHALLSGPFLMCMKARDLAFGQL
jgi:hypothetical protein